MGGNDGGGGGGGSYNGGMIDDATRGMTAGAHCGDGRVIITSRIPTALTLTGTLNKFTANSQNGVWYGHTTGHSSNLFHEVEFTVPTSGTLVCSLEIVSENNYDDGRIKINDVLKKEMNGDESAVETYTVSNGDSVKLEYDKDSHLDEDGEFFSYICYLMT